MAAKQPVGGFESMAGVDNVREVFAGKANGGAKVHNGSGSSPVTKADRYPVRIVFFKSVDVFFVLYNIRAELFFVRRVHMWYGIQCRQNVPADVMLQGRP